MWPTITDYVVSPLAILSSLLLPSSEIWPVSSQVEPIAKKWCKLDIGISKQQYP
jgi:hypothetical protein